MQHVFGGTIAKSFFHETSEFGIEDLCAMF